MNWSSLQYITLGNAHHHNIPVGEPRICTILLRVESLTNPPFMDHYSSHFIVRFEEKIEDVHVQEARSQQLLYSLQQKPLTPQYLLSALQVELANLDSIYISYKPLIHTATQLLQREPSFIGMSPLKQCTKRSLLPFLGEALSWLTGTATTKDVWNINQQVNQLIETQNQHQITLVHVISILNVTRYTT